MICDRGNIMTDMEKMQEKEIARLQRKIKILTEKYSEVVKELEEMKAEGYIVSTKKKRGRPKLDEIVKVRIRSLRQQGYTIREISEEVGASTGSVSQVLKENSENARVIYLFMDGEKPATLLDVYNFDQKIEIVNLTDCITSRAFGVNENPDWEDYQYFLESRCMPRTRFGIRSELKEMGLDTYDPVQIIEITKGRCYEDNQWLQKWKKEEKMVYDQCCNELRKKDEEAFKDKLLEICMLIGKED